MTQQQQEGHKLTISEEVHHALIHMVEETHDKQLINQAYHDDFSNIITAMIVGTIDTQLCIKCGKKLDKRYSDVKNYYRE